MELQEAKQQLRRYMREERRRRSAQTVAAGSEQITAFFCSWPVYQKSAMVMFYLAMPDEPQTEQMIQDALGRHKRVCVPLLGEKYGEMTAAEITGLDDLVTGKLELKMPDPDKARIISPAAIDLVVVPAVAFDRSGNRLGMGAGYYDRFLPQTPQCIRLGLAWQFQLVDSLPAEKHDVRMQYLLNEGGFLSCDSRDGQ
ncbi:5-formyltetrahydrofolate cyclo-ligase [Acetonema longum]|uniref:5-formyltetrahydrofolate cyclo-ligase n=1 Tax=Acetonema longum DSM 6540 TaxID=1009370 RepID=F7NGS2_9FIRM|nr:5-formyltetrahydrofolate cyclo-ligase [Acetonema longum]EGO64653.1 5-formyltetrahydrofolate cyclo-ligase [Acetonema longum DSM 6540]